MQNQDRERKPHDDDQKKAAGTRHDSTTERPRSESSGKGVNRDMNRDIDEDDDNQMGSRGRTSGTSHSGEGGGTSPTTRKK
jgi:hypothetical protein